MNLIQEYLKKAINGESSAVAKYTAFQEQAIKEGFVNIALLFKALVEAEQIHIKNHKKAYKDEINDIKLEDYKNIDTKSNIQNAIEGETYEFKSMYPSFIKAIKEKKKTIDGKVATLSMDWARQVEISHAEALKIAKKCLDLGKDLDPNEIWICRVCGNLVLGEKPKDNCPVCKHDPYFYKKVSL